MVQTNAFDQIRKFLSEESERQWNEALPENKTDELLESLTTLIPATGGALASYRKDTLVVGTMYELETMPTDLELMNKHLTLQRRNLTVICFLSKIV